jgi:hypothetical protein
MGKPALDRGRLLPEIFFPSSIDVYCRSSLGNKKTCPREFRNL